MERYVVPYVLPSEQLESINLDESGLLFHAKGRSMVQQGKALAIVAVENRKSTIEP